ncbi:protein stum [Culicoides brevitarsis]|uniref:protein stum n=1 Tax=Culicoides brevitarsis TaxID=469753 RepID=UPI00307B2866
MEPYQLSSSLRSRYDYYYSISSPPLMSPACNYYDNQEASLFGDPVPPAPSTTSGFSDTFSSSLLGSFSRHIDPKLAISCEKADLWQNTNKNIFKPRASTAVQRSDSPSSQSVTLENPMYRTKNVLRASTSMTRKRPRADYSMISTITKDCRQPSFTKIDYPTDYDSETNHHSYCHYAATPSDNGSEYNYNSRLIQSAYPGKRRVVESPSVQSVCVRPYSRFSQYNECCIEEEDEEDRMTPRSAIVSEIVPIGDGYRIKDARTHKISSFSVINEKAAKRSRSPYLVDPLNEVLRPRSASLDSTLTRQSRNLLSPDTVRDFKFGKFPRSQSSLLLSKKRAHEATIIRPEKFKQEPNATIGKSRRTYHGKIPQYWKRAGHDARVMNNLRESSMGTDISTTSKTESADKTATDPKKSSKLLNIPNPTSKQRGLLRQMTKDSNDHYEPRDVTRSKSAIKMPVMTAAQKLAAERARRAKSNSPAPTRDNEPQFLEVKKRLKTPFEVVEKDVKDPAPEPPPNVKGKVSKASNLSPIAGTPSKEGEEKKDKEKSKSSKNKDKLKEATTVRGRLKIAVSSGKERDKKDKDKKGSGKEKSTSREKSVDSAGKKKSAVSRQKSTEKKDKSSARDKSARKSGRDSEKERSTTREKSARKSASKDRLGVSDRSSAKSTRGKSGRTSARPDKDKDKKDKKTFKEKGSLIRNLGFLRGKKKPEKEKSKSASSQSGKDSAKSRKSTAVERKGPKLKLQKSTSAGTLKSQDSIDLKKEAELNKASSFRMSRKDLTSALSTRLKSAMKRDGDSSGQSSRSSSIFSLTRMKAISHNKANEIRKVVKNRRLEQELIEEDARKSARRLEKIESKDSLMSQATAAGDTQSITSKKTVMSTGSSTSLKRLKIGTPKGGVNTTILAASASNLTGTVTEYFDQKEVGKNNKDDNNTEIGASGSDIAILEKLKSIQRTVSDAADEIQKTIDENLTDLQTLDRSVPPSAKSKVSSRGGGGDDGVKTTSSRIVSQKSFENESNNNNNNNVDLIDVENNNTIPMVSNYEKDAMQANMSRIDVKSDKMSMKNDMDKIESMHSPKMTPMAGPKRQKSSIEDEESAHPSEDETRSQHSENSEEGSDRSGESSARSDRSDQSEGSERSDRSSATSESSGSSRSTSSSDTSSDDIQDEAKQGCLGKICGPCKRKKPDDDNEMQPGSKFAALKKLNCFKKQKKEGSTATLQSKDSQMMEKPGLCTRLCCCRRKDKVSEKKSVTMMDSEPKKGLAKICPCFAKKEDKMKASKAWSNKTSMSTQSAPKKGFCARLCEKLMCCRKKPKEEDNRRTSIISKKPSIGPTVKTEDSGPKIDASLVEHASMMRAAVPILKVPLAWICCVLNIIIPGLGTIISGWLCLCFGHPRFSTSDNWRGRIGTFIINIIVGVSQAFTIIFCLVGWGWSIWWGMMMIELAKKHKKLSMDAAMAENVEEGTISSNKTGAGATNPPAAVQNNGAR